MSDYQVVSLDELPFNAYFVAENGFAGIKVKKMMPAYIESSYMCVSVQNGSTWSLPGKMPVVKLTWDHPNNIVWTAAIVYTELKHNGFIQKGEPSL